MIGATLLMQEVARRGLSLGSALLLKEVRARELWPQYLVLKEKTETARVLFGHPDYAQMLKGNDCHNPAGSPEGGQFCGGGQTGGGGGDGDGEGDSGGSAAEGMDTYSALYDYQNYAHAKINQDLREGKTSAEHEAYVAALDASFSGVKEGKATVFRGDGAGFSVALTDAKPLPEGFKINRESIGSMTDHAAINAQLSAHFQGMVVEDKSYLSTSKSQAIAMDRFVGGSHDITRWGGTGLVEISGRMKALDIDSITKMGAKEKERLLPRGTKLQVDSVSVQPHPDGQRVYLHWKVSVVQ